MIFVFNLFYPYTT